MHIDLVYLPIEIERDVFWFFCIHVRMPNYECYFERDLDIFFLDIIKFNLLFQFLIFGVIITFFDSLLDLKTDYIIMSVWSRTRCKVGCVFPVVIRPDLATTTIGKTHPALLYLFDTAIGRITSSWFNFYTESIHDSKKGDSLSVTHRQ